MQTRKNSIFLRVLVERHEDKDNQIKETKTEFQSPLCSSGFSSNTESKGRREDKKGDILSGT